MFDFEPFVRPFVAISMLGETTHLTSKGHPYIFRKITKCDDCSAQLIAYCRAYGIEVLFRPGVIHFRKFRK